MAAARHLAGLLRGVVLAATQQEGSRCAIQLRRGLATNAGGAASAAAATAGSARQPWLWAVLSASLSAGLVGLKLCGPAGDGAAGQAQCKAADEPEGGGAGGLPEFTREEVAKHRRKEDRVWVTYKVGGGAWGGGGGAAEVLREGCLACP